MELLERETYIADLNRLYNDVERGVGHTAFLMGEAGIGKTSLLNNFLKDVGKKSTVLLGACDSLFTPRPLGPLFDIAPQVDEEFSKLLTNEKDRAVIFSELFSMLAAPPKPVVLVFEDIHWADDATFDLIKFLSRRINKTRCLFIVSFRDNEILGRAMASMFGELPVSHYSKLVLPRLSKKTIDKLALKSHNITGEQLFELTSGNPFYVTEILSQGNRLQIPERIKDSILARFHSRSDATKSLWEFLSVLPSPKIEATVANYIDTTFGNCIEECITAGIIVSKPGLLSFNHELFRITIEESLSHSRRKALHKSILQILQRGKSSLSQLVHHAKYAEEFGLVSDLAPRAAREASEVGAHREAATLYSIAIDVSEQGSYHQAELYERHAYECYLTYQLSAAIASQEQALALWRSRDQKLREGDALRFLSRLWWFAGDRSQAVQFGSMAIDVLDKLESAHRERAWAYSNFAQLEMLSENTASALSWGRKAIELAKQINDQEVLSHALNNVGSALLRTPRGHDEGEAHLRESLAIALKCKYQEHAARSYVNLGYTFYLIKEYPKATDALTLGIKYCEERDLDFLRYYMMACLASVYLETGNWDDALQISLQLQANPHHILVKIIATLTLAKIAMRRGDFDDAKELIAEVRDAAMGTKELQRIIPLVTSELELAWLSGEPADAGALAEMESKFFLTHENAWLYTEYAYWKHRLGISLGENLNFLTPLKFELEGNWQLAASAWQKIGCVYEQALAFMDGDEKNRNEGMLMLETFKANGTVAYFRRKFNLKSSKTVKGPRESTRNNPGQLTDRQIDILKLLQVGLQNKEIAEKLFISPKTVDHHISAILTKLDVSSRTKAVIEGKKLGILV